MLKRTLYAQLPLRSPDHPITGSPDLLRLGFLTLMLIGLTGFCSAQQAQPSPTPAQEVPVMDGGVGPCLVDLLVTDGNGKPMYAVTVKVHIAYGFAGIRKLDLEAGTNWDGKVRFKGLPFKVHNPPLEFHATKDDLTGLASYNPAAECQAKHDIVMEKLPKTEAQ